MICKGCHYSHNRWPEYHCDAERVAAWAELGETVPGQVEDIDDVGLAQFAEFVFRGVPIENIEESPLGRAFLNHLDRRLDPVG